MKNIFLPIIFIYILILLQTSFFIHFNIFNNLPNFILILVILINFLEKPQASSGWWTATSGGFFWDIFSTSLFIGFYTLILLLITFFIKKIFKKYFHLSPNKFTIG